ncbi:hypothetical protein A2865_04375 [Candidatus Woesebacteria bacterium RIFCSPHIGHO2_01_FULL_39_17]|uniref:Uncharacterized protein n=3 Tax=Candidatus Woeseibacteriota TaxID=1752722 RepID=A0A0G0QTV7_9BACT|nr:MAG: hypothetical protein US72_C0012G0055 [Microgenomates group bacterium GW2011_GWC1_38_12]KKQ93999.1 MAG: hypothetical protein UT19_C0005G0014 [Candidatus Woesebacteria bacterium GW2011_GWB1_39_10b]KKR13790.1 MAG: hypothetical protein UT40_C0010G0018 [Candidatus Woesebacteria bacterium GW2011_GWA1_39_21b]OGM23393.1 MAG: hypothetical protein A2865_04375 [Candidatus Woesebacteria bacterium RIFCSPHIGHO2_01_FULL_39_17]OGM65158.1 MAG: hypothetical protein A3A52_04670 [Candidatus Woesebacteria b
MDGFIKQTKKTAADTAKQVAKQIAREPFELLKTSKSQILKQEKSSSDIVQQIVGGDGKVGEISPAQKSELEAKKKKRIQELEEELKRISLERKRKEEEWLQLQKQEMDKTQVQDQSSQQLIEPKTKPRRGFLRFLKKKQGTKEMGKQISG